MATASVNSFSSSVTVTEQKRIIENEIRELRGKINNHLDKLQEDLLNELTEAVAIVTRQTSELMAFNIFNYIFKNS
jgi:hypothetical protein